MFGYIKRAAEFVLELPGNVTSGVLSAVWGSYKKNKNGEYLPPDYNGEYKTNRGLNEYVIGAVFTALGYAASALIYVSRTAADFISNHKTAINIAFWTSLVLAGAAALTVALWPAALAAVAGFSIGAWSIAAIVGTGYAAQVGAVAVLTAIATSAAVFASATVVNTFVNAFNFVRNFRSGQNRRTHTYGEHQDGELIPGSSPLNHLDTEQAPTYDLRDPNKQDNRRDGSRSSTLPKSAPFFPPAPSRTDSNPAPAEPSMDQSPALTSSAM